MKIGSLSVGEGPSSCIIGSTVNLVMKSHVVGTASERYNIGVFFGLDGGGARTGKCFSTFYDVISTSATDAQIASGVGPWWSNGATGDACGDIRQGKNVYQFYPEVPIVCRDNNQNNVADITGCVTWMSATQPCRGMDDIYPSTSSKCWCGVLDIQGLNVCISDQVLCIPQTTGTVGRYCDNEVVFQSYVRITASKTTTQWPIQSIITGIIYYDFQTSDERMAIQFFDPAKADAITTAPLAANILREDIINPCKTYRYVFCSGTCYTAVEKHLVPRFFFDGGDQTCTGLTGSALTTCQNEFCVDAGVGCLKNTTNMLCVKKNSALASIQGHPEAIQYIQGVDSGTGGGIQFVPCAARTFDGTTFEFFTDHTGFYGVNFGVLDNGKLKVRDQISTTNPKAFFDFTKSTNCPNPKCNEDIDIVWLVDEQTVVDTTDFGSYWANWISTTVDFFDYANNGLIKFGLAYGKEPGTASWPMYTTSTLTNAGGSIQTAALAREKQAGVTDFGKRVKDTIEYFWSKPSPGVYHPPRKLVVMVGGPSSVAPNSVTLKALYAEYDVEVWAVGIGLNGNTDFVLLNTIASRSQTVTTWTNGEILSADNDYMWRRLCTGHQKVCGTDCAGFCKCTECYCPICVIEDACNPSKCTVAKNGCQGESFICADTNPCTTPKCVDSNGPFVVGGTATCLYSDNPAYVTSNCVTTNKCGLPSCDKDFGCKYDPISNGGAVCNDNNICTTDSCPFTVPASGSHPPTTGTCLNTPIPFGPLNPTCGSRPCDISNPCGVTNLCVPTECFQLDSECVSRFTAPADATILAACKLAVATTPFKYCHVTPVVCPTSTVCQTFTCAPATGLCFSTPAKSCDDSDLCTTDSCDPAVSGGCVNVQKICDDSSSCTIDTCVAGYCVFTPQSGGSGDCCAFPGDCGDSNVCTKDTCIDNTALCAALGADSTACVAAITSGNAAKSNHKLWCVNENTVTCPTNNVCTNYLCNAATGVCDSSPAKICNDGSHCTTDNCDAVANPTTGCIFTSAVTTITQLNSVCSPFVGACDLSCRTCTCTPTSCTIVIDTTSQPICDKRDLCPSTYSCPIPANKCQFARCIRDLTNCAGSDNNAACLAHINNPLSTKGYCSTSNTNLVCPSTTCFDNACNPATGTCLQTETAFARACVSGDPCNPGVCSNGVCTKTPFDCKKSLGANTDKCKIFSCFNLNGKAVCNTTFTTVACPFANYTYNGVTYPDNCLKDRCDSQLGCLYEDAIKCTDDPEQCIVTTGCARTNNIDNLPAGCNSKTVSSLIDFCGKCKGGNVGCFLSDIPTQNTAGLAAGIVGGIIAASIVAVALAVFGGKKGYDYYQDLNDHAAADVQDSPMYQDHGMNGEMPNSNIRA